jgi:hypothetical protein
MRQWDEQEKGKVVFSKKYRTRKKVDARRAKEKTVVVVGNSKVSHPPPMARSPSGQCASPSGRQENSVNFPFAHWTTCEQA